jgi:ubiquinone/menaquinone biosynthesis C-methylase UbiE
MLVSAQEQQSYCHISIRRFQRIFLHLLSFFLADLGDLWESVIAICFPETASHTTSNVKVKTIDELKSYWTAFSRSFADNLALSTTVTGSTMLAYMKMPQATDILEIACGSGLLARFALQEFVSPTAKYTATDLSPAMLEIAKQTLSSLDGSRLKFQEANGEHLPFENDSFDRVIANYVLHLTTDPAKMLQEVYRVLKPGAVAGFSVWGRPENSPQFTINNVALKKLGVEMSSTSRSSFHLHDLQKTSDMVRQAAGFSRVVAYYTTSPFDIWTSSEFRKRTEGTESVKVMLKDLSPEQVELFWQYCDEEFQRIQREGSILRHEALVVIAFK